MSCCSGRRLIPAGNLRGAAPRHIPNAPAGNLHGATVSHMVYNGVMLLSLRGPFSGAVYRADPEKRALDVDPRDADALLRTGLFTVAG
jgi:hypothetical protein